MFFCIVDVDLSKMDKELDDNIEMATASKDAKVDAEPINN